ncbi:hypothetical protein N9B77_06465 [Flavobacteriaceae bacterium]|nr:hypothetical protein [Flavobacteriaceae bacterium]
MKKIILLLAVLLTYSCTDGYVVNPVPECWNFEQNPTFLGTWTAEDPITNADLTFTFNSDGTLTYTEILEDTENEYTGSWSNQTNEEVSYEGLLTISGEYSLTQYYKFSSCNLVSLYNELADIPDTPLFSLEKQ